jgi:hypothetical protein
MAERFPVLLVDDGELDEVRDCLLELRVEFAHLRGGAVPARLDPPRDLFLVSARRAALAKSWPAGRPVRIAVVGEDSGALRATLRKLGFQYLVRRPIHPIALRLLVLHALYRGDERRSAERVPLGYRVAVKIGMRRREGLLVDLSESGCRLLLAESVARDAKITVQVPAELCGDESFALPGRVLRCQRDGSSPADGSHAVAIRFGALPEATQSLLEEALAAHRLGVGPAIEPAASTPAAIAPPAPAPAVAPAPPASVTAGPAAPRRERRRGGARTESAEGRARSASEGSADRRRAARRRYARRVIAAVADGTLHRVLIGRDVSPGGMRVDRQADLHLGTTLRIALYDAAREAPVIVAARVARDDGKHGLALRFEDVEPDVAARIEQLIATLPPVECLFDGEAGSIGTVVAEIVK